jgi:hypothetical protein
MPALILRDIPALVYRLLKMDAHHHHRSMNRQAVSLLEKALVPPPSLNLKDFPKPLQPRKPIDDAFILKAVTRGRA